MKKVFLTGASSGIGRAIAEALVGQGHEVWGTARALDRLPQHERLHAVALDLRDRASLAAAFAQALEEAGHFDVLINNAGSGYFGPAENLSHDELADHFQILFFAPIELMHLAAAAMRKGGRGGLIINVSSLASRLPVPFMASYNAAKAALASFAMSLQLEWPSENIHLVDLQPGDINTGFNDAMRKADASDPRVAKAWRAVDKNMRAAPGPELVARQVLALLAAENPPPRVTVADFFQGKIAPLVFRLLPQRLRIWGLKKYYGI